MRKYFFLQGYIYHKDGLLRPRPIAEESLRINGLMETKAHNYMFCGQMEVIDPGPDCVYVRGFLLDTNVRLYFKGEVREGGFILKGDRTTVPVSLGTLLQEGTDFTLIREGETNIWSGTIENEGGFSGTLRCILTEMPVLFFVTP